MHRPRPSSIYMTVPNEIPSALHVFSSFLIGGATKHLQQCMQFISFVLQLLIFFLLNLLLKNYYVAFKWLFKSNITFSMSYCTVLFCTINKNKVSPEERVSFYEFSRDLEKRTKWIKTIPKKGIFF